MRMQPAFGSKVPDARTQQMLHGPGREEEAGAARLTGNVPAGLAGTSWQWFLICAVPTKDIRDCLCTLLHGSRSDAFSICFVVRGLMSFPCSRASLR